MTWLKEKPDPSTLKEGEFSFEIPICTKCDSDNVLIDAYARVDMETGERVLHATYDEVVCNDCGSLNYIEWRHMVAGGQK